MATHVWADEALDDAIPAVFWSDRPDHRATAPSLHGVHHADLAVVGGGFTGLWTAILAVEEQPGMEVVVVESQRCGFGASSRNGGFCDASLTHGLQNGLSHWPDDIQVLLRMGIENLNAIEETIDRHSIEADFRRTAEISVATERWHLDELAEALETHRSVGANVDLLDQSAIRAKISSPTYLGALARHDEIALVDPARLCWGLASVAERLGVRIFEETQVRGISRGQSRVTLRTDDGVIHADRAIIATNAYRGPTRSPRRYIIPVYDHVLMTEPLNSAQLDSIGWSDREGLGDVSNQFHYYRMSDDNRILWGGYDAIYHFNNGLGSEYDQNQGTHATLARHFFETFPQLEGLRFTHRWGGPIATTTRFTPAWGRSHGGNVVWVGGYTGLGVGASRFGGQVAVDLVLGRETERTELEMVRKKPFPFPPEPMRWMGVQLTRKSIQRADRKQGRRNTWLRVLDRFGVGFDS